MKRELRDDDDGAEAGGSVRMLVLSSFVQRPQHLP